MNMSTTTKARLEITVVGRVQGVHFRTYTQQRARQLGLTGWVANHADGTVRVAVEGEETALDALLTFLNQGPPMAQVDRVQWQRRPADGSFEQFRIHYS